MSYYRINKKSIITSIANLEAIEANVVILLYGNLTKKQDGIAQEINKLRINHLSLAIIWLKEDNSEWKSVLVSIEEIVEKLQNSSIIANHRIVDDEDVDQETQETCNVLYPDGNINVNSGGQENIQVLQELVYEGAINNRNLQYHCNLLKESVQDYKDKNLVNACLLQFPFGRGGIHEQRFTSKDRTSETICIQEYVKYLSMNSQSQFHTGLFSLILFNMMVKQKMVRTASWKVRNKLSAALLGKELQVDDVYQAIIASKVARGSLSPEEFRGRHMLHTIDTICQATLHSNESARCAKKNAEAIQHQMGCPAFF